MTLNFETDIDAEDLQVDNTESYTNDLFEAKLDYTDSSDHPLADNYEFYDPDEPYASISGDAPTITETNSGRTYNFENQYLSENDSSLSSWLYYQQTYTAVDTSKTFSDTDSNIIAKLNCMPWYTAPPSGYTSEYYIYPTSDTSQTSTCYRYVATRLKSDEDSSYSKYRFYMFFYAQSTDGSKLTYYTDAAGKSAYASDDDWPTITMTSETIYAYKTARSSVKFTYQSTSSLTTTLTYYLDDKSYSANAGKDSNYQMIDTSKKNSDFPDALCRQYVYKYMTSLTSASTYSCDIDTDIVSDTDTYPDGDDEAGELCLDMDTSRWPFTKTYFGRLVYDRDGTPQYRNYRYFTFVFIKGTGKIKMMHFNNIIGASATTTNYCDRYPHVGIRSIDESSKPSIFYRYSADWSSPTRFYYTVQTYTKSTADGTISTGNSNGSYYSRFNETDLRATKIDKSLTQDDFDDEYITSYLKTNNSYAKDGSGYTTTLIIDYDEVSKYVKGMENFPYLKFAISKRTNTSGQYDYYYYLFVIYKNYGASSGQSNFVYSGGYATNSTTARRDTSEDYWPTWTLYAEGESTNYPTYMNDSYIGSDSILYYNYRYYTSSTATSETTTYGKSITLITRQEYAYADTLFYNADIKNTLVDGGSMTSDEYYSYVNTETQEAQELDYINRHLCNTYTYYSGVDETKDNYFNYYINADGQYVFNWSYYKQGYLNAATISRTPIEDRVFKSSAWYMNPLYNGGIVYSSSGSTTLTTDNLDPSEYEYQGYEIVQNQQQMKCGVNYIFQSNVDDTVQKFYFDLGSSTMTKTYFSTFFNYSTAKKLHFVYTVHVKAKNDTAAENMETWLKGYNFQFSLGINREACYGDYYEA